MLDTKTKRQEFYNVTAGICRVESTAGIRGLKRREHRYRCSRLWRSWPLNCNKKDLFPPIVYSLTDKIYHLLKLCQSRLAVSILRSHKPLGSWVYKIKSFFLMKHFQSPNDNINEKLFKENTHKENTHVY